MQGKVIVGVGQFYARLCKKRENTARVLSLIDRAANDGVELFVLPEYSDLGSVKGVDPAVRDRFLKLADPVPGAFSEAILERARRHRMYVYLSAYENTPEGLYNCGLFACPDGELFKYRKMHRYKTPFFDETYYFKQGDEYCLVDTPFGKVGLLICFDAVFPETARVLTLLGARLILVAASWPREGRLRYEALIPARAVENQVCVLASGMCGGVLNGQSMIVNFDGTILSRLGEAEGLVTAEIDLQAQEQWRKNTLPCLYTRRPAKYGLLGDKNNIYAAGEEQ